MAFRHYGDSVKMRWRRVFSKRRNKLGGAVNLKRRLEGNPLACMQLPASCAAKTFWPAYGRHSEFQIDPMYCMARKQTDSLKLSFPNDRLHSATGREPARQSCHLLLPNGLKEKDARSRHRELLGLHATAHANGGGHHLDFCRIILPSSNGWQPDFPCVVSRRPSAMAL